MPNIWGGGDPMSQCNMINGHMGNDRQTPMKTLPSLNLVAGGNEKTFNKTKEVSTVKRKVN